MKQYKQIRKIELDLSSNCISYRSHAYVIEDGSLKLNPHVNFDSNITVDIISKVFDNTFIDDHVEVSMTATTGDPMANPNIISIVEMIYELKPNANIVLYTNAGLKSPKVFVQMAEIKSSTNKKPSIWFSIDGLEDTNHFYKDVAWEDVFKNVVSFTVNSGQGQWIMMEFEFNKHQIEEATQISEDWGLEQFVLVPDNLNPDQRAEFDQAFENKKINETASNERIQDDRVKLHAYSPVTAQCLDGEEIYINSDAILVPCSSINSSMMERDRMRETNAFMYTDNDKSWNSLHHNSLFDIMDNTWWNKLASTTTSTEQSCTMCVQKCGTWLG